MRRGLQLASILFLALSSAAAAPATRPASQPAQPRKVLFLVDGTGSMIPTAKAAADEISKAVDGMPADYVFSVAVAVEPKPAQMLGGFQKPSDVSRQRAFDFVRTAKIGGTDAALVAGVGMIATLKPDVVWFISDGEINDRPAVEAAFRKVPRGIRVNTTTKFVRNDDAGGDEQTILRTIAAVTGGKCVDKDGNPVKLPAVAGATPDAGPAAVPAPKGPSIFRD